MSKAEEAWQAWFAAIQRGDVAAMMQHSRRARLLERGPRRPVNPDLPAVLDPALVRR